MILHSFELGTGTRRPCGEPGRLTHAPGDSVFWRLPGLQHIHQLTSENASDLGGARQLPHGVASNAITSRSHHDQDGRDLPAYLMRQGFLMAVLGDNP